MRTAKNVRFVTMMVFTVLCLSSTGCYEYLRFLFDAALLGAFSIQVPQGNTDQPAGSPLTSVPVVDVTTTTPEDTAKSVTVIPADQATAAFLATVTATITTNPANGTVAIDNTTKAITYTPNLDYNGPDTFVVQVCSSQTTLCGSATVNITVTPVNDPPVVTPDSSTITKFITPNPIAGNVLTNDTDVDGGALTVSQITSGTVGAAVVGTFGDLTLNADGSYSYLLVTIRPATAALGLGQTGADVFNFLVSDGSATAGSTITITVNGNINP